MYFVIKEGVKNPIFTNEDFEKAKQFANAKCAKTREKFIICGPIGEYSPPPDVKVSFKDYPSGQTTEEEAQELPAIEPKPKRSVKSNIDDETEVNGSWDDDVSAGRFVFTCDDGSQFAVTRVGGRYCCGEKLENGSTRTIGAPRGFSGLREAKQKIIAYIS